MFYDYPNGNRTKYPALDLFNVAELNGWLIKSMSVARGYRQAEESSICNR